RGRASAALGLGDGGLTDVRQQPSQIESLAARRDAVLYQPRAGRLHQILARVSEPQHGYSAATGSGAALGPALTGAGFTYAALPLSHSKPRSFARRARS